MSTAVLISGQLRTFARCFKSQYWHVLRHFDDRHFFIVAQKNEDFCNGVGQLVEMFGADRVHALGLTDPDLSADITPQLSEAYHEAPYANAAPALQLLMQHWYQNEVWKLFQAWLADNHDSFDRIIRLRGDLFFHSFSESIPLPHGNQLLVPRWGGFGGINDRFAILGRAAAKSYFTTYERIPRLLSLGCPFHPESLVKASCAFDGIRPEYIATFFSTKRPKGTPCRTNEVLDEQGYPTRWPEITAMDMVAA